MCPYQRCRSRWMNLPLPARCAASRWIWCLAKPCRWKYRQPRKSSSKGRFHPTPSKPKAPSGSTPAIWARPATSRSSASSCIRGIGREWPLFKHLRDTLHIPIKDLRLKEAGGSGAYLVISLKKQFDGQVRQLMYGAWSQRTGFGKITVVVDDDIDVWDDFAVDWALSWHVRPDKDIHIERDVQAVGLDPSQAPASVLQHHPSRYVGSRLAIDATRKHEYPAISLPPKEHLDLVASHWRG